MPPKFLIEKTATGERTLVEGELPLRVRPPYGAGTYTVRSVSEQSTDVTISEGSVADSAAPEEPVTQPEIDPAPVPAPQNVEAAQIAGPARIGTAIKAAPGLWEDAARVTGQWLRDGAPIAGATDTSYTPVDADDRRTLVYREIAESGGGKVHQDSNAVQAVYPAPTAKGGLHDEIFDLDSGNQIVETAQDFEGEALTFSVTGTGAKIDPVSGRVTLSTDAAIEGEVVTVTATNSGGSAPSAFQVTVEELDAEEAPEAEPTREVSEIQFEGATFRFSKPVQAGRFANGDWFVIAGDATLTEALPASFTEGATPKHGTIPNRVRHGLVNDPEDISPVGFDSEMGNLTYDAAENIDPGNTGKPLALDPGMVLLKAISKMGDPGPENGRMSGYETPIKRYVTLTVLAEAPPKGAFRPPVKGWDGKTFWSKESIDWSRLPAHTHPWFTDRPSPLSSPAPFWWSSHIGQQMKNVTGADQHNGYYRFMGQHFSGNLRWICSNAVLAERKQMALQMIQDGIDASILSTDAVKSGHYNHGPLIVYAFAAHMLNDPAFDALVNAEESWPADNSAIDQLQKRYIHVSKEMIDVWDEPGELRPQPEHLNFPMWVKVDKETPPDNLSTLLNIDRRGRYRELNFISWNAAGICFHLLREDMSRPHDPETNPSLWDRIKRYPARDYLDRLMGWNEQLELGRINADAQVWSKYPADYREWDAYRDIVLKEVGYKPMLSWNGTKPAPEHPNAPSVSYDGATRALTVKPDPFRALNMGFPHSEANLKSVEMRYKVVAGQPASWKELQALLDKTPWTKKTLAGISDVPTIRVPAGAHAYAVQIRHVSANGNSPWSYNEALSSSDYDKPAAWQAAGLVN